MRTRTAPNEALDRLERLIQAHPPIDLEDLNAVDDLRAFIADMTDEMPHTVDVDALHKLLEGGFLAYDKTLSEWVARDDWGGDRLDGWGNFASALDWECHSCRSDVGWSKWDTAIRDFETKVITIHVECGHCGDTTYYDKDGDEVEESA